MDCGNWAIANHSRPEYRIPMIRRAIIPVAGLGTRLMPMTAVLPKALFPLVDSAGRVRAVLHQVLAEAAAAGVRHAGVIVSPGQRELLEQYFAAARAAGADDLPSRIEYILQPRPAGFGEAVLRSRDFVADEEAFMLLLGDHVYRSDDPARPCAAQVTAAFDKLADAQAVIGMQDVDEAELPLVGTARGEPLADNVYRCTDFIEKPAQAAARQRLVTPGLPSGRYLAHCGIYLFRRAIFDCLQELDRSLAGSGREVALADAQSMLLERFPQAYYLVRIAGRALDTGTPRGFVATVAALAAKRE